MEIYLKELALKNFGRFKNIKIDNLSSKTLYIVTGENCDFGGANGIGKSHLLESIVYGLYGESIRTEMTNPNDYVSFNENEMGVYLKLKNNISILRGIKDKKEFIIIKDEKEKEIYNKKTNTMINQYIDENIYPFHLFKNLNYFNPNNIVFFGLQPKMRYQIIEELLNLDELTEILRDYEGISKDLISKLNSLNLIKQDIQNKVEKIDIRLQFEIEKLENELDSHNSIKDNINNMLDKLNTFLSNKKTEYNQLDAEYKNITKEIKKIEKKIKPALIDKEFNYQEAVKIKNKYNEIKDIVEKYLKSPNQCPLCKQAYKMDINGYIKEKINLNSLDELKEKIEEIEVVLSVYEQNKELENELNKYQYEENKNKTDRYNIFKNVCDAASVFILKFNENNTLKIFYNNYDLYNDILNDIIEKLHFFIKSEYKEDKIIGNIINLKDLLEKKLINKLLENDKSLDIEKQEHIIDKLKNEKKYCQSELEITENKINEVTELLTLVKKITDELGWSGKFRKDTIEKYMKKLEKRFNEFVKIFLPNASIKIELNQSGRDKGINVLIYENESIKKYGQLSSGEKRMIDISLLLTLSSYSVGILLIDEALDNLSYNNQLKVCELLRNLNRQIFLVSHNQELIDNLIYSYDNIKLINIARKNGISNIKINDEVKVNG
jgi:DNA repair exonuclease SbcCD ATPase subunit